ncbi:response regulator transcription factor [Oceanisphaera sp. W20_SRM_FM3]|uniref:response regulator transcription factor n=1 Tax=Oceanisphaera sp. W20_SRM_FM3 TaxID=3240267 RepID=UPI003F9B8026
MQNNQPKVAIIEDNADLREELIFFLQHKKFSVWGAESAEIFWKQLHGNQADIVLVDLELPGEDGFSVVEYLNKIGGLGVIIMTARGQQQERLHGLSLGADLFLVKPVNFAELAEAINALWQRRGQPHARPLSLSSNTDCWQLLRTTQILCSPSGEHIKLSAKEYTFMHTLGRHANEVLSREELHNLMFEYEDIPDLHRIDVILNRLRNKAKNKEVALPVRSIFGKGLVFKGKIIEI